MRNQYRTTQTAIACQVTPDQVAATQPAWTAKNGTTSGYMMSSRSRSILVDKLTASVVSTRGPPPRDGSRLGPGRHVERCGNKNTPTAGKNFVLAQAISRGVVAADGPKRRAGLSPCERRGGRRARAG